MLSIVFPIVYSWAREMIKKLVNVQTGKLKSLGNKSNPRQNLWPGSAYGVTQ